MIPIIILSIENEDDREFMSRLYLDYRKRMFAQILRYVSDRSAAEDVLHDAVVKLIGKTALLRTLDEKRLVSYVTETAKNAAKDFLRRQTPSVPLTEEEMNALPDCGELPEERVLRSLRVDELRQAWGRLSESAQDILKRKYMLMLSDEEIAAGYGIRREAVRMRLTRARREVYALLEQVQE